jgi:hypothetical protein
VTHPALLVLPCPAKGVGASEDAALLQRTVPGGTMPVAPLPACRYSSTSGRATHRGLCCPRRRTRQRHQETAWLRISWQKVRAAHLAKQPNCIEVAHAQPM